MDIRAFRRARADGLTSAAEQAHAGLDRVRRLDSDLRAVLATAADAVTAAEAADDRADAPLGPLDGVTVLVQDNIATADLPTTLGSHALEGHVPVRDAAVVAGLRASGAVVLGKANLTEWMGFRSTDVPAGWSRVGGQAVNPHVLGYDPGGAAAGAAIGVAAFYAQAAVATDTDGSVLRPAGLCGVVGMRPSPGLVDRSGIALVSGEQDVVGVIARSVTDVADVLSTVAGRDLTPAPTTLAGKRIGYWYPSGVDRLADAHLADAVAAISGAGAEVIPVDLPDHERIDELSALALLSEFRASADRFLADTAALSLADVAAVTRTDPGPYGHDLLDLALDAPPDPRHRAAATRLARAAINGLVAEHRLDAVLTPTNNPATPLGTPARHPDTGTPAAVAGYPVITVPAGYAGPLPIGVSFFTGSGRDSALLAIAAAFEQVVPARRDPERYPRMPT